MALPTTDDTQIVYTRSLLRIHLLSYRDKHNIRVLRRTDSRPDDGPFLPRCT